MTAKTLLGRDQFIPVVTPISANLTLLLAPLNFWKGKTRTYGNFVKTGKHPHKKGSEGRKREAGPKRRRTSGRVRERNVNVTERVRAETLEAVGGEEWRYGQPANLDVLTKREKCG
ncbi:hypothetical protein BT69DRAFT_1349952 [Atractiella rhizophila]|nr:hypothetical protein BT69DRAFT_1349952 [Atractiella rhizophila]